MDSLTGRPIAKSLPEKSVTTFHHNLQFSPNRSPPRRGAHARAPRPRWPWPPPAHPPAAPVRRPQSPPLAGPEGGRLALCSGYYASPIAAAVAEAVHGGGRSSIRTLPSNVLLVINTVRNQCNLARVVTGRVAAPLIPRRVPYARLREAPSTIAATDAFADACPPVAQRI
jgi:hypothetical protein